MALRSATEKIATKFHPTFVLFWGLLFSFVTTDCGGEPDSNSANGDADNVNLGCPSPTGGGQAKIESGLDAAWEIADPGYQVRIQIELIYKADIQSEVSDPTDPIELAAFKTTVASMQACTVSFLNAINAEIVVRSALNTTIVAKCNRAQGLQVAGYPDVAKIIAADSYPPPAGSLPCDQLGQNECTGRSDCALIMGQIADNDEKCLVKTTPLGCATKILTGGGSVTWAVAPTGQCAKFPNNLIPSGWSTGPNECADVKKLKDCKEAK